MRNLSRVKKSLLSAAGALGLVGAAFAPAALAEEAQQSGEEPQEVFSVTGKIEVPEGFDPEQAFVFAWQDEDEDGNENEGGEAMAAMLAPDDDDGHRDPVIDYTPVDEGGHWELRLEPGLYNFGVGSDQNLDWVEIANVEITEDTNFEEPIVLKKPELVKERYAGENRYDTNYKLVKENLYEGDPVFIATGAVYADALTVGPAAVNAGGSLVLTPPKAMNPDMLDLLKAKQPEEVYVIGGEGAVSADVAAQLEQATGKEVKRIGGVDRYETAEKILNEFFVSSEEGAGFDSAFVATGRDFPDALSASAAGGILHSPILLVKGTTQNNLSKTVTQILESEEVSEVNIVGGTGVVSQNLENNLRKDYAVERLAGKDRYGTNLAINEFINGGDAPEDSVASALWIATGKNFPDALSAAVPAGSGNGALVLSNGKCVMKEAVAWVDHPTSWVNDVNLFGGESVLAKSVENLDVCR